MTKPIVRRVDSSHLASLRPRYPGSQIGSGQVQPGDWVGTYTREARSMTASPASWRVEAACSAIDADVFFAVHNEGAEERRVRESEAKSICATCAVIGFCHRYALETSQSHGVWGGLSPRERKTAAGDRSESVRLGRA
ncbi:WhiB family transcriptional regulator [Rhodococcus sp. 1168]|uniref:WhiB family transcriptional regulator n=1 Tax=Rhodococcus sp. 1168 TaxID=2018041 RepID=UPI0034CEA8D5